MTNGNFKDNFSKHAALYAKFRPQYPEDLFAYLSALCPARDLAWDCATGNGQCAVQLIKYFDSVYASDASAEQILNAQPHSGVEYRTENAEHSSLENSSADLVVVAQALHWFDHKAFFTEAKRVMKKDAVIAIISYVNPVVSAEIDAIVDELHDSILNAYWQPENKLIFDRYKNVEFPFQKIACVDFEIKKELDFDEFTGHLRTWSAVQRYIDSNKKNPLDFISSKLKNAWGGGEKRTVTWPLHIIAGK